MKLLASELKRLEKVIYLLEELLSTKTTKLPPAAIEDLRTSLNSVINRLTGQAIKITERNNANDILFTLSFITDGSGASIHEQLWGLQAIVTFLYRQTGGGRKTKRRFSKGLYTTLPEVCAELEGYFSQLQDRRLDRDYLWLAESATAPYWVGGVMPFKESGFLVLANSPGMSFETSAPHNGPGESPADISVDVYLDTEDDAIINEVMGRVDELVEAMGYQQTGDIEITRGSIFRRSRAAASRVPDEIKSRLMKVERALELAQLELRQADVDRREADAVNKLINSLENVPRACLRVGSVLLIKYPHATGEPVVIVRNLSQLELHALDRFPEIQRSPERALQALSMALDDLPSELNQLADGDPGNGPATA